MLNTYAMYCDMELFLILHRSKDEHNKKLKQLLAEEVSLSKENVYSPLLIDSELSHLFRLPLFYHSMCLYNIYVSNTGAIQCYFELSSDGGETMIVHQPPWRSSSKLCFPS